MNKINLSLLIVSIGFVAPMLTAMEKKLVVNPELEQKITRILDEQSSRAGGIQNKAKLIGDLFLKSPIFTSYDPAAEKYARSKIFNGALINRIIESNKNNPLQPNSPKTMDYIRTAVDLNTIGARKWLADHIKKNSEFEEKAIECICICSINDDSIDKVKFLINAGTPLNEKVTVSMELPVTPLMRAAQAGALKITHAFIDAGADATIVDFEGNAALDLAIGRLSDYHYDQANIKQVIHDLIRPTYLPLFRGPKLYFSLFPRDLQGELMKFYESAK